MTCTPNCNAIKFIVVGLLFIVNRMFIGFDDFTLIGVLMLLWGLWLYSSQGTCMCESMVKKKSTKKK